MIGYIITIAVIAGLDFWFVRRGHERILRRIEKLEGVVAGATLEELAEATVRVKRKAEAAADYSHMLGVSPGALRPSLSPPMTKCGSCASRIRPFCKSFLCPLHCNTYCSPPCTSPTR